MLESLDQTNIGRLNLGEPAESGSNFNPRTDISLKDWENMKEYFWQRRPSDYVEQAVLMKAIFPERVGELELGDFAEWRVNMAIDKILKHFTSRRRSVINYSSLIEMIANGLVVFPESQDFLMSKYADLKLEANKKRPGYKDDGFVLYENAAKQTLRTKKIFISSLARVSREDLEAYPNLENDKNEWLGEIQNLNRFTGPKDYITGAAKFRLVFPTQHIEISRQILATCNSLLRGISASSENNYGVFTEIAYALTVLSAQEIKYTDHGIELVFPEAVEALAVSVPALPETRKF
ncbi:MAG: hypothetical protein Q7R49_01735 [Candidatus Daviesbacteria bacterium]|nr:hypothetical protein [Candidatus Daviesbacteria bacterium]